MQHVQLYVSCLLWSPYIRTAFFIISCLFSLGSESGEVFQDFKNQLEKDNGCGIAWQQNICYSLVTSKKDRTVSPSHSSLRIFYS